jgi:hypothetical protein
MRVGVCGGSGGKKRKENSTAQPCGCLAVGEGVSTGCISDNKRKNAAESEGKHTFIWLSYCVVDTA